MKRVVSCILLVALMLCVLPMQCYAAEVSEKNGNITYFADGSYAVETLEVRDLRASGTKNGSRSYTYYSSSGTALWKATLTAKFSYTGSSATCTSASCSVSVYDSDWYTISKSADRSGNTGTASVTMGQKLLGVTVNEVDAYLEITCDANGNLS